MKKRFFVGLAVLGLFLAFGVVNAAPSTVEVNWNQAGYIDVDVTSEDDFHSYFEGFSTGIGSGKYKLTDSENNPYGYGVDTVAAQLEADVSGGGYLIFDNTRTDSKVSMYGPAGENSQSIIETSDTAMMQFRTRGAFAELKSCNYGFHASNHFQASGVFSIYHHLYDDTGEGAWVNNIGDGTSNIDLMSESTSGKTGSFKFGKGCGCYTNADITATGSGVFEVGAVAENQIKVDLPSMTISGDGTLGSAQYLLRATYGNGFTFSNFALEGN
jgi:hypothetical protein